jgi:hypothetical protein
MAFVALCGSFDCTILLPDIVEVDLEILNTCEEVRVRSTSAVPIESCRRLWPVLSVVPSSISVFGMLLSAGSVADSFDKLEEVLLG